MPTPIPHAEVLIGQAHGREAQTTGNFSEWYVPDLQYINPLTHPHWKWRLKPEPKVVKVRVYRYPDEQELLAVMLAGTPAEVEAAKQRPARPGTVWLSPWTDIEITE